MQRKTEADKLYATRDPHGLSEAACRWRSSIRTSPRSNSRWVREWYMHPNGQLPAYEWALGDVNPPVHAWATWRVYKIDHERAASLVECVHRDYHGVYTGDPASRDVASSRQGLALLPGPFLAAYRKANGRSTSARRQA